ncbi:hypothetical protein H4Q26_007815 [Puccinia striiformis f. sp. tritici PST-130]|nr:hypothetical protein H4Q26_007815 [Puccinia striiformis f. sp. tritici PST-130]
MRIENTSISYSADLSHLYFTLLDPLAKFFVPAAHQDTCDPKLPISCALAASEVTHENHHDGKFLPSRRLAKRMNKITPSFRLVAGKDSNQLKVVTRKVGEAVEGLKTAAASDGESVVREQGGVSAFWDKTTILGKSAGVPYGLQKN